MSRPLGVRAALVGGEWVDGDVEIEDGRIVATGVTATSARAGTVTSADRGGVAVPGFVDLQLNGFAGIDFRTADAAGYALAAHRLAATGTTSFLPTFYSTTIDGYVAALAQLHHVRSRPPDGARILGAHLEGPFLSRRWAGAHDPAALIDPDLVALHRLLGAGPISLMTLAPELPAAGEVIRRLIAAGVVVSMGHTDANAPATHAAADNGVSMLTHCWNAHHRYQPRDPGPAAVALGRLVVGLICDRVHVADDALRMTFAAAPGRVCVVTDAVAPAGTNDASWAIDGVEVTVSDGRATLADGTLAGSVVTMEDSLRNLVAIGIDAATAITAMSTTPAQLIGAGPHDLSPASEADVVVLDERWRVLRTVVAGRDVAR